MSRILCFAVVCALATCHAGTASSDDSDATERVFSGPQPGESVVGFRVIGVYADARGSESDPIEVSSGEPTLLVFVHQVTRPGIALVRGLTGYAKSLSQKGKGVKAFIVWLDDDRASAEEFLVRAKGSLNFAVPVGVSVDGGEGPGVYGLNRNVELTVLIVQQNQVTANFALVQPSVTDGPKIAGELAKLVDEAAPTQQQVVQFAYPGRGPDGQGKMQMRRDNRKSDNRKSEVD